MKKIQISSPAPVLNTPDFSFAFGGKSGREIPVNSFGHPYSLEWVALTGMEFDVLEELQNKERRIYRVAYPDYCSSDLYIDADFTQKPEYVFCPKTPSADEALEEMGRMAGTPYVWGGNWNLGVPKLLEYYPPQGEIDEKTRRYWTIQGLDCSGLLFQVMRGITPRNTSQLLHLGQPLPIQGRSPSQILSRLQPLDMIIYPGHVLFVFDSKRTIESRASFGVIYRDLKERLAEISSERNGLDEWEGSLDPKRHFMIRRILPLKKKRVGKKSLLAI